MTPESDPTAPALDAKSTPKEGVRPRVGVPVWRTGKPDAFLAAAVDVARAALEEIAPAAQIGRHLAAKSEGDRLVTHLFESKLAGYGGWQWYAVLTRNSRSKAVTVDELGLLPSEDSILAPEWIPWAERVRPGDEQGDDELATAAAAVPDAAAADDSPEAEAEAGADEDEDAPEDDSDDADGHADGSGDDYDADDVDANDADADAEFDDNDDEAARSDENAARSDGLSAVQTD